MTSTGPVATLVHSQRQWLHSCAMVGSPVRLAEQHCCGIQIENMSISACIPHSYRPKDALQPTPERLENVGEEPASMPAIDPDTIG